jgi:hypothetical protein
MYPGANYSDPVLVFWDARCVDLEGIKFLANSFDEIIASPAISVEASRVLGHEISSLVCDDFERQAFAFQPERPVAFFVSNDTIARMMVSVVKNFSAPSFFVLPNTKNEGALDVIRSENLPFEINRPGLLASKYPSVVVLGNDWGWEEKQLVKSAAQLKIPSVCIQEGCLDWQEKSKRMQWATFSLVQGPITIKYLPRNVYFITGNPRFDSLAQTPLPVSQVVMINSNFTYGIFEEQRDRWLADVTSACCQVGFDFFISQHPRDGQKIDHYPVKQSNVGIVHSHISDCSILVSRFSTVVYEAALMGRHVIYYNPHGETMQLFNDDDTAGIYKAYCLDELLLIFEKIKNEAELNKVARKNFNLLHCGNQDGNASKRCANSIGAIMLWGYTLPRVFLPKRFYYFVSEQIVYIFVKTHNSIRALRSFLKSKFA